MSCKDNLVAVVLAGCGVFDGSEIHETSAICVALSRRGKRPIFYAPDKRYFHEVNHVTGEATSNTDRNVLIEAGRIARGQVHDLKNLSPDSVEAVIFPGGFGAAKNLSTFGVSNDPEVDPEVARVLKTFHEAKVPIGMCCISPILAALVLSKDSGIPVKITLGDKGEKWPYDGTIDKASEFGALVSNNAVDEICIDSENRIVTVPAFMYEGEFHEIFDGIDKMVEETLNMI